MRIRSSHTSRLQTGGSDAHLSFFAHLPHCPKWGGLQGQPAKLYYCEHLSLCPDPASDHYYQPMWTLVGGGVKTLAQSRADMSAVLPSAATWLQDSVTRSAGHNTRL